MSLIEIALYYRERRLCSVTTAALALLTPSCTRKFKLVWWKAAGNGVFWRQDITWSDRGVHPVLHTRTYLLWPICPWMRPCELFVLLKTRLFWDSMVPCCTSWNSGCFYPSKKLKILQFCNWKFCNSENFTTAFCNQGGHRTFSPQPLSHAQPKPVHFAARWHPITLLL